MAPVGAVPIHAAVKNTVPLTPFCDRSVIAELLLVEAISARDRGEADRV